jgi:hypothetical protein
VGRLGVPHLTAKLRHRQEAFSLSEILAASSVNYKDGYVLFCDTGPATKAA